VTRAGEPFSFDREVSRERPPVGVRGQVRRAVGPDVPAGLFISVDGFDSFAAIVAVILPLLGNPSTKDV
jgi:hypothetical protein